jgi:DNA repair exonuclease SbcCD ATPase subunit
MRMMEDVKSGKIGTIITKDLSRFSRDYLMTGQYIQFCNSVSAMVQKLLNLKKGIKADMDSMKEKVDELKRMNDNLMEQISGLPVERKGDDNGDG